MGMTLGLQECQMQKFMALPEHTQEAAMTVVQSDWRQYEHQECPICSQISKRWMREHRHGFKHRSACVGVELKHVTLLNQMVRWLSKSDRDRAFGQIRASILASSLMRTLSEGAPSRRPRL